MLAIWFLLIGLVLVLMAIASRWVERLPVSAAIVYLAVGACIGPLGTGLLPIAPLEHVALIEALAEIGVLISLFAVGLKLRIALGDSAWRVPLLLATLGMVVAVALTALAAHLLLALPLAAALLLGAVLAPTDPVLASEVQVRTPGDRDTVRLSLSAEGGINDGSAFPAVMLALGLLGTYEIGAFALRWVAIDLAWAVVAGVAVGWACGVLVGRAVVRLRTTGHALEFEEFLVLGVIALAYGIALLLKAYGFLAVFAAGLALRQFERAYSRKASSGETDPALETLLPMRTLEALPEEASPARLADRLLTFTAQTERLVEVAVVLLVGAMLTVVRWSWPVVAFAVVTLVVIRPVMVFAVVPRRALPPRQRRLVAWFGIRGLGSVYYLFFALRHGVTGELSAILLDATLATIAGSILIHGVSATPLMVRYHRWRRGQSDAEQEELR